MPKEKKEPIDDQYNNESAAQDTQRAIGVGRAGSPIQALPEPGLSYRDKMRIRKLGMTRVRVNRPGKDK